MEQEGQTIDDWLDGLRHQPSDPEGRTWIELVPSRLCTRARTPALRPDKLLGAWVRCLVASACGVTTHGVVVGLDVTVTITPMDEADARSSLGGLLTGWREGMAQPLPVACLTAIAALQESDPEATYEGNGPYASAEVAEACLARIYPDFESLSDDGQFKSWAEELYAPVLSWAAQHVSFEAHPSLQNNQEAAAA